MRRGIEMYKKAENNPAGAPGIMKIHVHLAKCDYFMRMGADYSAPAEEQVSMARDLAGDLNMPDLKVFAEVRVKHLESEANNICSTGSKSCKQQDIPVASVCQEQNSASRKIVRRLHTKSSSPRNRKHQRTKRGQLTPVITCRLGIRDIIIAMLSIMLISVTLFHIFNWQRLGTS